MRHHYNPEFEMRDEYDLSPEDMRNGIRGHFVERFKDGVHIVPVDPDPNGISPRGRADRRGAVCPRGGRAGHSGEADRHG